MFCPGCGADVKEGRKFCGKCGAVLNAGTVEKKAAAPSVPYVPVETVAPASAQPTSPQRKAAYALVALLMILGSVGRWLHRPPDQHKPAAVREPTCPIPALSSRLQINTRPPGPSITALQ